MTKDNYKEYYEQWKEIKDLPDYQGKRTYGPIKQTEANEAGETRYSVYNAIKDANDELMAPPDPDKETMEMFLTRAKFTSFGGSSTQEHLVLHDGILRKYKPKIIVEIGFNTGLSAMNFLKDPNVDLVVSFDILMRFYSNYSKWYIDKKYPGRHILIAGDSTVTIPTFIKAMPHFKADFLYIDASHELFACAEDMYNCMKFAHNPADSGLETIVVLDNVVPHRGLGANVYNALLRGIFGDNNEIKKMTNNNGIINDKNTTIANGGYVHFIDHIETGDYKDGFAIYKYNIRPEDKFTSEPIDYKYIERRIECYYYTYLVQNTKDHDKLIELKEEIEEKIKEKPENFDMYVILEINKKLKEFGDFKNMSKFRKRGKLWTF